MEIREMTALSEQILDPELTSNVGFLVKPFSVVPQGETRRYRASALVLRCSLTACDTQICIS
jgi:hypothetical protein